MNLAPNGKPSNLTPEQYKLVRTTAFKNWFGDWDNDSENASKVVDENGEPLVVFHGSGNDFNIFKIKKKKKYKDATIIFSSNPQDEYYETGAFFSNDYETSKYYSQDDSGFIRPFFLDIKNPFFNEAKNQLWNKVLPYIFDKYFESEEKYDGIIVNNINNVGRISNEYVVIEPNQIKLADGSNTTFDSNNNDIRFDKGGLIAPNGQVSKLTAEQYDLVRTKAFKEWFGDWENDPKKASKVIDENGEPLVVYHGSKSKDTVQFNKGENYTSGSGIYFTNSLDGAKSYSRNPTIYSVFLNIRNPNIKNAEGRMWDNVSGGISIWDIVEESKKNNYNGVIVKNIVDSGGYTQFLLPPQDDYIVYDSTQIKLADGSNTTFDSNNNDIRFDEGGLIKIQPIQNELANNYFKRNDAYGQFIAKNGNLFYIVMDISPYPKIRVFDAKTVHKNLGNGYGTNNIAIANFNVDYPNKIFSGYSENQSIFVENDYRRIGIASAITDFAEEVLGMNYVPSKLLSNEMQGFVNNRFNYEKYGGNNPDIRFDEGGLVGDVFTKKVYIIRLSGGDWFEDYNSVYDDYEDALNDYNKISNSDFDRYENSKGLVKTLSEKTLKYKFVAEIDEDDNIDDYTDTITLKNKTFWQIIDDGEWNDLEADSVERINEKADKLLSEVYNYYGRKYNTIYLDEDETISLKLRIADHSGKWKNKGSEDYFLSIVISDKNPTEDFYMNSSEGLNREQEEVFSSENTFEEIIEFINEKIEYYKEKSNILFDDGGKIPKELYHYTSEKNFDRIFDSNILNPSQKYGNRLSFTSDSEYHKKKHGLDYGNTNVRITFDNEKLLSDGYSFSPFDHNLNQNKIGKEFEYVISTPIENVKKYIKNITIFEGNAILGYIDKNATDYANKYYFNSDIRYKQGGLIAPNGKPSNLTAEQYKLVRTKAFKKWFGDWETNAKEQWGGYGYLGGYKTGKNCSLGVDENGEPKIFYHQTTTENYKKLIEDGIINFEIEYGGGKTDKLLPFGFYLKPNSEDIFKGKDNYFQITLFLNIRSLETFDDRKDLIAFYQNKFKGKYDKKFLTNYFKQKRMVDCILIRKDFDFWEVNFTETLLVLNKNQIKLADGSNTTFDSNNNDIRYDEGGNVKYLKGKKTKIFKILQNNELTRDEADSELWNFNGNYSQLNIFEEGDRADEVEIKALDKEGYFDIDVFEKQISEIILKNKLVDKIELEYGDNEGFNTNWLTLYELKGKYADGGKIPNVNHKDIQGKEFTYDGGKFLIVDFPNKSGAWNKGATWRKTAKHHSYIIKLDDIETNLDKSLFHKFNKPYYIYDDYWLQFNQKPCRSIQGSSIKLIDTLDYEKNKPNNYADGGEVKSDYIKRVKEAIKYVENSPKARMRIDFEDEEGSKQATNEGKDYERIFPLKSKSNSFIVKKIREGVQDKYYSIGTWNEKKKSYDYRYPKNEKYGDKSKEFDTLQIAIYDEKGKIVGILNIATSENKKEDVKKGSFKISVRQDYQNKGIASKLIEKAESEGIDFVEALKNNNFTSEGRWYFISWLNKKLKNKAKYKYSEGGMPKKEIFNSIGSAIGFGTIPMIEGHDMVAECDCGEKFTYQNSKKDILWQCPKCNVKKGF